MEVEGGTRRSEPRQIPPHPSAPLPGGEGALPPGPPRRYLSNEGGEKAEIMPIEILMPALSPTMTEGNLARWVKKEGDAVHSGDVLAEIETDKATMEVEAVDDGRVGRILVPEGTQGVKVNQPIALLLGEGEDPAALATFAAPAAKPVCDADRRADNARCIGPVARW